MKKTNKKALIKLIESQSKGQTTLVYNEGTEDEIRVNVVGVIPYSKRLALISELVALNFAGDASHIDDYMPSAWELARKLVIVRYYSDLKLPNDINDIWLVLNHTTIFHDICQFVGSDINDILSAADKQIKTKVDYLAHQSDLNIFLKKISGVIDQFGDSLKGVDLSKMISILENMSQFSSDQLVDSILKVKTESVEENEAQEK